MFDSLLPRVIPGRSLRIFRVWLLSAGVAAVSLPAAQAQVRLYTSPALSPFLAACVPALREAGINAAIRGEASSSIAVQTLAAGQADAVFTVRSLTGEDRALAPGKALVEVRIATQATAFLVSRDVWEGGVRAVTREQVRRIYEREITGWKELGGLDRPLKFYNYAHGQGIWEQFAQWLYGEIRRAPLGSGFPSVVSSEDAHTAVEFNNSSMTMGSPLLGDAKEVFALALGDGAAPVTPTREHILDRTYPLARPIFIVFADRPTGPLLKLRDFFLSAKAQELISRSGLLPHGDESPAP